MNRKAKRKPIACGVFALMLVVMLLLRNSAKASGFLARNISANIVGGMGRVSSLVPFSLYETFLYVTGAALVFSLALAVVRLFRRKWKKSLNIAASWFLAVLIFACVYMASAGFFYNQKNPAPIFSGTITEQEFKEACDYFLGDFNALAANRELLPRGENGMIIKPYSDKKLSDVLRKQYSDLGLGYTPKCKTILASKIMSHMQFSGVFFAPFGEPNINKLTPASEKPFVMAHEMAHAKGIMTERDANDMAAYVTLTSPDPYIRYSGYMESFFSLLDAWKDVFKKPQVRADYRDALDEIIFVEYAANYAAVWGKYNKLAGAGQAINDNYLKGMGESEGTGSYSPKPETETIPKVDEETGEIIINPETNEPEMIVVNTFNARQRMYYNIFCAVPKG